MTKQIQNSNDKFSHFCHLSFVICYYLVISHLSFVVSCSPKPSSPTLVSLNNEAIPLAEFQQYQTAEQWKFDTLANSKQKVLDDFLKERLLLQEAKKRGLEASSAEIAEGMDKEDFQKILTERGWTVENFKERRKEEVMMKKLADQIAEEKLGARDEDLKKYYISHRSEFWRGDQVHARQIVTDSKEKAESLRAMITQGSTFEEVASKYSLSPDRKSGGDLGWFEKGIMPKEFDDICFYMKEGELSSVVATPYGFHLFLVLGKKAGGELSFEEAKEKIKNKLMAEQGRDVFQKWFEKLRADAKVKINEELFNQIH